MNEDILRKIKNKDERITEQRKIILEELKNLKTHPTAKELYFIIKEKYPNISLVTIYRTLNFLVNKNLIIKLKFNNKETHYDGNINPHHHFICEQCGKIIDVFENIDICQNKTIFNKYKFQANLNNLEIYGICHECLRNK